MNKALLETFIRKYHINGNPPVEDVIWEVKDNRLTTRFITDDQTVLGEVTLKKFDDFGECELGVYTTSQLLKMLGVLDLVAELSLERKADKFTSIQMTDGSTKINYMLADKNVIRKVPSLKQKPDFDITVRLSGDEISKFIRSKNALTDVDTFTFLTDKSGGSKLVIGYSSTINSNRISMDVDADHEVDKIDPLSFNANHFKEILIANKEANNATLSISTEGLAYIKFDLNDFLSEYFLVQIITGA